MLQRTLPVGSSRRASADFIEGQNLKVDWRGYGLHPEQFPDIAVELIKAKVDFIFCAGGVATRAAQLATAAIPILAVTDDMVGSGLVRSLARPGGNTTGVSILATELDGKRQEILIEAVPGLRHIVALADTNTTAPRQLQALQEAARARGAELSIHRVAKAEEIAPAIDIAKASNGAALNVLASPLLFAHRQVIIERVATLRLPASPLRRVMCYRRHRDRNGPAAPFLIDAGKKPGSKLMFDIRRRDFITLLGGTAVMWPLPVHAQQLSIPLIGFMSARSPEDSVNVLQAFHKGLKDEGGFTNGENVNVEYRWARGNYGLLPALAGELVVHRVNVLVAVGGDASARAAKAATSEIPIVFTISGDPVEAGLVQSLNRPGGNATGCIVFSTGELDAKRLDLMSEIVPGVSLFGVLVNS